MRYYFIFTCLILPSILPPNVSRVAAEPIRVELTVEVVYFNDDRAVSPDAARVRVTAGSQPVAMTYDDTFFKYITIVDSDLGLSALTIEVTPTRSVTWKRRDIRLRRRAKETHQIKRHVPVFVVAPDTTTDYSSLDRAVSNLNSRPVEWGLAYFEFAYSNLDRPSQVRQYLVKVLFNYARVLKLACLGKGYDTCTQAMNFYVHLHKWFDDNEQFFSREHLTRDLIEKEIDDLKLFDQNQGTRLVLQQYSGVEDAYRRGGLEYGVVARRLEGILAEFDANAAVWSRYGKPKVDLLRDCGLSWLNYALVLENHSEVTDTPSRIEFLNKSQVYLREAATLGDSSKDLRVGLQISAHKLSEISLASPDQR